MTTRTDPNLLFDLQDYGALHAEKCINCGNCTAICNLTTEEDRFPRQVIRMVQMGMKEELLGSKEIWLCYNCGQCSETCPQQAEPANLMAAARCYAITHYAPFKLGLLFCKYPLLGGIIATLLILFFGLFMYGESDVMATDSLKLFGFLSRDFIHIFGLVALIAIALIALFTIYNMIRHITRANHITSKSLFKNIGSRGLKAFWEAVFVQALAQKKYRQECEASDDYKHWFLSKWFVHAATMWGFLGLLLATVLNFLLDILNVKPTGAFVPLWYPTRLIGTLSGILFIYGVSILLYKRLFSVDKAHSYSRPSDWIFLALLFLSGVSGFIIEIALYLPGAPMWGYWMFIVHVALSMGLLLLLPFTKFAHAIYRTIALFIHELTLAPE
jgi:nitrate reductase gamma subunit/ferredoxin